jgi:hypothetical protein
MAEGIRVYSLDNGTSIDVVKDHGEQGHSFMLAQTGRVGGMVGSEDVVGSLITRAPLRVSIKRDQCISDLLHRVDSDFLESGKHEIVTVNEFLLSAPEAAAHLKHALGENFKPPTGG